MNRSTGYVIRRLAQAWQEILVGMQRMSNAGPRPLDWGGIFIHDADSESTEIKFTVRPIVFNVPERANGKNINLYIVLSGWLSFETEHGGHEILRTRTYGTRVAYFRDKGESLDHVYGTHYDMEELLAGHPVFHAQMASQVEFAGVVKDQFGVDAPDVDLVMPILHGVRVPTAQMDVFSVVLQICADHLLSSQSASEVKDAFQTMVHTVGFFSGAGYRMPLLTGELATSCYRSMHWYPE